MSDLIQATASAFGPVQRESETGIDIHAAMRGLTGVLRTLRARPELMPAARARLYRRLLLLDDPVNGYSVWGFTWAPGAVTPIHDHHCWCLTGTASGTLIETRYRRAGLGFVQEMDSVRFEPGSVAFHVPGQDDIHRIANDGDHTALSIHVYGASRRHAASCQRRTYEAPGEAPSEANE